MSLYDDLTELNGTGRYPMHMPGHKRRLPPFPGAPVEYDFTEIEGSDDLHRPQSILADAMRRTADLTGADRTFYLVNGSTGGNLAAVTAMAPGGGELIVARNCHQSVFHALEINRIRAHWVWPSYEPSAGIWGSVRPEDVEKLLVRWPAARGVVVTSPTYEGVLSDIAGLASVCHRRGVPLCVDEAHGAHLGLVRDSGFPDGAVRCGADLTVQSAHKTLIGLTQAAYLHLNGSLVDPDAVQRGLDLFETSSPSYLLMLSLDGCTERIVKDGDRLFGAWRERLRRFREGTADLTSLHLFTRDDALRSGACFDFDESKLLLHSLDSRVSGKALMETLRSRFRFELEMAEGANALAMTGPGDSGDALDRFADALRTLDREYTDRRSGEREDGQETIPYSGDGSEPTLSISEALLLPAETIPVREAEGRVAAESVIGYPPGIPMLLPGERVTEGQIRALSGPLRCGGFRFSRSGPDLAVISVLRR